MIATQTFVELGLEVHHVKVVGVYCDEVGLVQSGGYARSFKDHVDELNKRSEGRYVVAAKFTVKPDPDAHSSYGRIRVTVLGDEFRKREEPPCPNPPS